MGIQQAGTQRLEDAGSELQLREQGQAQDGRLAEMEPQRWRHQQHGGFRELREPELVFLEQPCQELLAQQQLGRTFPPGMDPRHDDQYHVPSILHHQEQRCTGTKLVGTV